MAKTRYGLIVEAGVPVLSFAASQVFKEKSGRFVAQSGGYMIAATNGINEICGYVEFVGTTGSSNGDTKLPIDRSCEKVYEIPIYKTIAMTEADLRGYIGDTCDLYVASNIQYADLTNIAADDILTIVGGDVAEQTLYVQINANKLGQIKYST